MASASQGEGRPDGRRGSIDKETLGFARDLGKFLLEIALTILIIYCLFQPQVVRGWLSELGISKVTLFGVELTPAYEDELAKTIQKLTQERDTALDENKQLREGASQTLAQLKKLQEREPAQSPQAQQVQALIRNIGPIASAPARSVTATSRVQQNIIQGARENVGDQAQWAVVFGADRDRPGAEAEIRWAQANGIPTAGLVFRQNYYRSVAFADNAQNASAILDTVKRRRPEAYIVNFTTWCPRRQSGEGLDSCP